MKLLFVGWGRAGKDEAASYLSTVTSLRYAGSTSWAALPYMAARLGQHPQVCWENRHKNRELWKQYLDEYRGPCQTLLARIALQSGDICSGVRDIVEIQAIKREKLFDRIIWIDRPGVPQDPTVTFTHFDADEVLYNNGSLAVFHAKLRSLCHRLNIPLSYDA
jgi:hypothetical protein